MQRCAERSSWWTFWLGGHPIPSWERWCCQPGRQMRSRWPVWQLQMAQQKHQQQLFYSSRKQEGSKVPVYWVPGLHGHATPQVRHLCWTWPSWGEEENHKCSGQKTPDSTWGRLSEALGNWGSGNLEGGGFGGRVGTGEVSLQATWDRGGRILSQLGGFQVSRRGWKGEQRGISKGRQEERGMRRVYGNLYSCI